MLHSQVCVVVYVINTILWPLFLEFGFHKVVPYCTCIASSSGPFHYFVCPQFSLLVHKQKSVMFKDVIVHGSFNFFHSVWDSIKTLSRILFRVCLVKGSNYICSRECFMHMCLQCTFPWFKSNCSEEHTVKLSVSYIPCVMGIYHSYKICFMVSHYTTS